MYHSKAKSKFNISLPEAILKLCNNNYTSRNKWSRSRSWSRLRSQSRYEMSRHGTERNEKLTVTRQERNFHCNKINLSDKKC